MIKYIEFKIGEHDKMFVKIDSVKEVDLCPEDGKALINGRKVEMAYEDIKAIICGDERRVCYSDDLDFRLRFLIRENLWAISKLKDPIGYIRMILDCTNEGEIDGGVQSFHSWEEDKKINNPRASD